MMDSFEKMEVLSRIQTSHAQIETLLQSLTDEQLSTPAHPGEWSIKDHLAHLTAWEQTMMGNVRTAINGERATRNQPASGESVDDLINRINETHYQANQDRPLSEVVAEFYRSYREVLEFVANIPESVFNELPAFEERLGRKLIDYVAGDTFGHYAEHAEQIRAIRDRLIPGYKLENWNNA